MKALNASGGLLYCSIVYILAKNTVLSLAEILSMHVTHAHRGFLFMIRVPLSVFALLQSDYAGGDLRAWMVSARRICGHERSSRQPGLTTKRSHQLILTASVTQPYPLCLDAFKSAFALQCVGEQIPMELTAAAVEAKDNG